MNKQLELAIIKKAAEIANIVSKNHDCEIRKSPTGISVIEVQKKVVSK